MASIPNGRHDNTHYNIYGARVVAGLLADAIVRRVPSLKKHLRHYDYVVSSEGRGNYMSLQEAIADAPSGKKTVIRVLDDHYQLPPLPSDKRIKIVR